MARPDRNTIERVKVRQEMRARLVEQQKLLGAEFTRQAIERSSAPKRPAGAAALRGLLASPSIRAWASFAAFVLAATIVAARCSS
jgi:hypothetical protein